MKGRGMELALAFFIGLDLDAVLFGRSTTLTIVALTMCSSVLFLRLVFPVKP